MQTNKILRGIVLGGMFVLPFIFFWNPSGFFFPFITGKNFAFRIIVELIAALAAILALRDPAYRPKRTWILTAYLAFIAILAIADIFGADLARSFWSNSERMDGLITQLHLFLYFLVACVALNSEKLWQKFLNTTIGASVIMAVYGLLQVAGLAKINQSAARVDGKFGNATYLAVYILFHVFLILYLLAKHWREAAYRWLLIPALALELLMLYYTATRGDILGVGFGILAAAVIVAIGGKEEKTLRKVSLGIIAAAVLVVGGFIAIRNTSFVQKSPVLSRFASISATDGTTESRILIWTMAVQGWKERPVFGWGQENFNLVFSKYYDPLMYGQEPWFDRAHNVFFDWLVSGGIFGLAGYLALFGVGIWTLWRNPRFALAERAILTGLFAGYFFQNLFVFDNLGSYFMFFTVLAFVSFGSEIGHGDARPVSNMKNPEKPGAISAFFRDPGVAEVFSVIVAVLGIAAIYFLNVPEIQANRALISALQSASIPNFQRALSYGSFAQGEIREQITAAALGAVGDQTLTDNQKLEYVNFAIAEMKKEVADKPLDVRTKLLRGSLLNRVGLAQEALPVLEEALRMSPKKQTIYFEIAESNLQLRDTAAALGIAKAAYDLAPGYRQAASIYASVAIYAGRQADADAVFKANPDLEASDDSILQSYANAKQYAKVAAIWKIRFEKSPANPDLHVTYAAQLSSFGMKQQAIAELRSAIAVENASEKDAAKREAYVKTIESYIAQIQAGKI